MITHTKGVTPIKAAKASRVTLVNTQRRQHSGDRTGTSEGLATLTPRNFPVHAALPFICRPAGLER